MIACNTPNLITMETRESSILNQPDSYRRNLLVIINVKGNRVSKISHKILVYDKDKIWFPIFPEYIPNIKKRKKRVIDRINESSSPYRKLNAIIAHGMRTTLRKKRKHQWEKILGYTSAQLKKHLEKRFTEGMTWKKFHNGEIHIDHILPRSKFNYEKIEDIDFHRCWALKNLQPLWATDNHKKHAKTDRPVQTSFIFK